ncbi:uncharacterized protein LOC126841603 isoform X2 [Adelges cooleyi]|uniref:uncharacterized protein LOC126841603 isoform X1 n=1 Tax=Adelges cooleyi TaxID=133065 RepID=UPI0021804678|nr:uncharacterized protein LOC126841603 isoform X1 [Adelges cooleyi]XP_050434148.1 uncharacterized protein LOC126841603 isoform X2 [Adelges cooleyi]
MNNSKSVSYRKCGVKYRKNRNSLHSAKYVISHFTLPKDSERRAMWIENGVPEVADKNVVVKDYFEDKNMVLNVNRRNRLTDNAVPTLFNDVISRPPGTDC